jgi:peptide/nickel transport system substrate-binding protein
MSDLCLSRRALLMSGSALSISAVVGLPRPAAAQKVETGGTLLVAADSEPRNLNPAIVASNGVFFVSSKVIEPLAEMDYQTGLRPLLAESWEGSEDGLSYTVHLRPEVAWHDGTPFTSGDVAFSAMQVWKPLQNLGQVVFANLEAVDLPDDVTAVFRFSQPTPAQLIENAMPALTSVLPRHLFVGTDIANNPYNNSPVGTGPFLFTEYKPGELFRLTRNPAYWNVGLPHLDEIIYRVLPDAGAKAAALETGDIHLAAFSAVPLYELERLDAIEGLAVYTQGYEGITYQLVLEINHRRAELADVKVRRALAMAIDPAFIVDTIFLGYGATVSTGPIPHSATDFYSEDKPLVTFDPAAAEALLDEAGYPRGDGDSRFALRLRPAPWFEQTRAAGDYVRQALQAIGIEVEIVSADPAGHTTAVYTDHDFDLAIGSPVYRNDPAISTTILFQGGLPAGVPFSNQYGYDNPAMNEVIAAAAHEIDPEKRIALYADFQRLAAEQLPIVNLVEFTFTTVASDKVKEVSNNPRWATSSWADTWLET